MADDDVVCARCKKPAERLAPMPSFLRLLMIPGRLFFPFRLEDKYCQKCRRAMTAPVLFLLAIVVALLIATIGQWLRPRGDQASNPRVERSSPED